MSTDSQNGLFEEKLVDRIGRVIEELPVAAGAGINKRFKPFDPAAVMLVSPSLADLLPADHLACFVTHLVEEELDLGRFLKSLRQSPGT